MQLPTEMSSLLTRAQTPEQAYDLLAQYRLLTEAGIQREKEVVEAIREKMLECDRATAELRPRSVDRLDGPERPRYIEEAVRGYLNEKGLRACGPRYHDSWFHLRKPRRIWWKFWV
jgi:hypothetical protein